jgi:hypothetical protein
MAGQDDRGAGKFQALSFTGTGEEHATAAFVLVSPPGTAPD